jgi:hypothetical protein
MRAAPALHHLHILRVGPAEKHDQMCVVCNRGQRRQRTSHSLRVAEYMRQEGERRAEAVIRCLIDEAAESREKAAHLGARVMEDPGRSLPPTWVWRIVTESLPSQLRYSSQKRE